MSESALHSKKPWRAVLARRRWRSGYNAGGSPNFIGKLFWNLRHNKLDYNNVNYNKLGNNKFGINEQIFSDPKCNKNNYVGQRDLLYLQKQRRWILSFTSRFQSQVFHPLPSVMSLFQSLSSTKLIQVQLVIVIRRLSIRRFDENHNWFQYLPYFPSLNCGLERILVSICTKDSKQLSLVIRWFCETNSEGCLYIKNSSFLFKTISKSYWTFN